MSCSLLLTRRPSTPLKTSLRLWAGPQLATSPWICPGLIRAKSRTVPLLWKDLKTPSSPRWMTPAPVSSLANRLPMRNGSGSVKFCSLSAGAAQLGVVISPPRHSHGRYCDVHRACEILQPLTTVCFFQAEISILTHGLDKCTELTKIASMLSTEKVGSCITK